MNNSERFSYSNMDSYVVHIYRRDRKHPEKIVGTVETIHNGRKDAFKTASELFGILTKPADKIQSS